MSKYIEFVESGEKVTVISTRQRAPLGEIVFHFSWNQYVFEPISNTIFNDECLEDIVQKIKSLNKKRGA